MKRDVRLGPWGPWDSRHRGQGGGDMPRPGWGRRERPRGGKQDQGTTQQGRQEDRLDPLPRGFLEPPPQHFLPLSKLSTQTSGSQKGLLVSKCVCGGVLPIQQTGYTPDKGNGKDTPTPPPVPATCMARSSVLSSSSKGRVRRHF